MAEAPLTCAPRARGVLTCAVVVPTWRGASLLPRLLDALRGQSLAPSRIIVADTISGDGSAAFARDAGCTTIEVAPEDFNHGGTRNLAAAQASEEVVVFLTQDALPIGADFLERLIAPFTDPTVAAAYARQVAYESATPPEVYARGRNYPQVSKRRTIHDLPTLGVRGVFFSNVASAVRRSAFNAVGGFPADVIMNEDMVLCSRLLRAGHTVAYVAEAAVRHSHDYSLKQQFRRYFDIGVFFHQQRELMRSLSAAGEGLRFAVGQVGWLIRHGHFLWALRAPWESAAKLAGFRLGRLHWLLPRRLLPHLSMHRAFWSSPACVQAAPDRPCPSP